VNRITAFTTATAALTLGVLTTASGAASANAYTADADCAGLTVDLPRAEDGTTVTAYRNGTAVRTVRNDTFGAPVRFTIPSPDQTVTQTWRVTVVGFNGSSEFNEVVAPCATPPTSSTVPTSSSAPPSPSTTVPTTVVVTTPPVPSVAPTTTVVSPPRPTGPTTPTVNELPATGGDWKLPTFIGVLCVAAGAAFVALTRRSAS
jgi:hypothetical protein